MSIKISSASMQAARDRLFVPQSLDEMMRESDRKDQYSSGGRSVPPTAEELAQDQEHVECWNALGQQAYKNEKLVPFIIAKAEGAQKCVFSRTFKTSAYYDKLPKKLDKISYKYWQVWAGKELGFVCRLASMPEDFPWMDYDEMHSHLIVALREE